MPWNFTLPREKKPEVLYKHWDTNEGDPDVLDTIIKPAFTSHEETHSIPKANAYLEHITQEWVNAYREIVMPNGTLGRTTEYGGLTQRRINSLGKECRQFFGLLAKLQWYRNANVLHLMKGWQVTVDDDLENKLEAGFNRKMYQKTRHLAIRYKEAMRGTLHGRWIYSEGHFSGLKAHVRDHMTHVTVEEDRREKGEVYLDETAAEFPNYTRTEKLYYRTPTSPEAHQNWDELYAEENAWFTSALYGTVPQGTRSLTLIGEAKVHKAMTLRLTDSMGSVHQSQRKYEWLVFDDANAANPQLASVGRGYTPREQDEGKYICARCYYRSPEDFTIAVESPMTGPIAPKDRT